MLGVRYILCQGVFQGFLGCPLPSQKDRSDLRIDLEGCSGSLLFDSAAWTFSSLTWVF